MKVFFWVLPLLLLSACASGGDSGSGPAPSIIASSPTLALGSTTVGTPSGSQAYTVSGAGLGSTNVSVTAPAGVELRVQGGGAYSPTLTLTTAQGVLAPTNIEARISAAAPAGSISGSVTHTSGTALALVVVTGTVNAGPAISLSTPSLGLGSTPTGSAGTTQTYTVSGSGLTSGMVITAPTDVELRTGAGAFGPTVNLTPVGGAVAATTIEIRISAGAAAGSGLGNVSHTTTGASEDLAVTWTVSVPVIDQWQLPAGLNPTPTLVDPHKRYGHGLVMLGTGANRRMVAWGGITVSFTDPATNSAVIYDPATDAFEPSTFKPNLQTGGVLDCPQNRHGMLCIAIGDKLFVWGGSTGNNASSYNDGGVYDFATDSWFGGLGAANFENFRTSGAAGAPSARAYSAACWTGAATNKILIWGGVELGGLGGGGDKDDGFIYDIATDTWSAMATANAPTARSGTSFGLIGDKFFVHGGSDTSGQIFTDGGVYDLGAGAWVTGTGTANFENFRTGAGAPLFVPRSSAASAAVAGKLFVYGGITATAPTGGSITGWVYDPATDTWPARAALNNGTGAPALRYAVVGCTDGSSFFVFGGTEPQPSGPGIYNNGGFYQP